VKRNIFFKGLVTIIATIVVLALMSTTFISCLPEQEFGTLTVCSEIDPETKKPSNDKSEFDVFDSKIYATISASGIKADDNMRFTIKEEESGTVVADLTEKYSKKEDGFIAGNFYIEYEKAEDSDILLPPGKYIVDFYHNGELKDSANFNVGAPQVRILEISLANEVDQNMEPVNTTQEFNIADTVYACVSLNYIISGNTVSAKWYSGQGELLEEKEIDITEDYYEEGYVTFSLVDEEGWTPGKYYVEIYLNDSLYGKFDFEVMGPEPGEVTDGAVSGEISFNQNNVYFSEEYGFSIAYPDNWTTEESEDETGLSVIFNPTAQDFPVSMFVGMIKEGNWQADQLESIADEITMSGSGLNQVDKSTDTGQMHGFPYEEYDYVLEDEEGVQYEAVCLMIKKDKELFLFFGINMIDFSQVSFNTYVTMLQSISFGQQ